MIRYMPIHVDTQLRVNILVLMYMFTLMDMFTQMYMTTLTNMFTVIPTWHTYNYVYTHVHVWLHVLSCCACAYKKSM